MASEESLLCFVCNEKAANVTVISKSFTNYSNTPYAQCIGQVLGKDFLVVVSPTDKVCKQCSSLINRRDKLKIDLNEIESTLAEKLKKKYELLVKNTDATPPSAEFQAIKQNKNNSNEDCPGSASQKCKAEHEKVSTGNEVTNQRKTASEPIASTSTASSSSIPLQFYLCKICKFSTVSFSDLKTHKCINKSVSEKNNPRFQCNLCVFGDSRASTFMNHLLSLHEDPSYHCNICQATYHNMKKRCSHVREECDDLVPLPDIHDDSSEELPLAVRQLKSKYRTVMVPFVESTYTTPEKKKKTGPKKNTSKKQQMPPKTKVECIKMSGVTKFRVLKDVNIKKKKPQKLDLLTDDQPDFVEVKIENVDDESPVISQAKQIFECGICSTRMDSREELQEHFKTHSKEKIHCTRCKARMPSFAAYKKHLMYHVTRPSDPITCSECGVSQFNFEYLKAHMRAVHKCKYTCAHCEEQFAYVSVLKRHIKRHIESTKYFCQECNVYFAQMQSYRHHLKFVHRDPKCKVCGKIIQDSRKLRDHEKRHITEKEGLCPYCGKVLKTKNALKIHLMQHTDQYKYRCEICNKGITTRHAYNEHMNRHSSTPKLLYTCDKCGKQFNHNGSFSLHRKWHDNPFPYTCEYCGLKIRHTSLLRNHIRKEHTGEKPHECPHCQKRFLTKGQLRSHLPQHTGIFEFNCVDCNKGWVKKEYYNNHRFKVHGDPLPKRIIRSKADYKLVIPADGPPPPLPIIEDSSDDNDNGNNEISSAVSHLNSHAFRH